MGTSSSHRGDIQGLRAVAVLLVALGHAGVGFLDGGFVGVDVFFVLSGFLITGLLLSEAREKGFISLRAFYLRRARRLLPAAVLTLLVTQAAAFLLLNFVRAKEAMWDSLFAALFVANFRFAEQQTDYFADAQPPSPLLHFWSLAVEEQFYLVWPALLSVVLFAAVSRRLRGHVFLAVAVITCASLAWSVYLTAAAPPAAYFSPLTRAWELGLGASLAVAATTLARIPPAWKLAAGWTGLLGVAGAAVLFTSSTPFPGYAALLPTLGTALVICAGVAQASSRFSVARVLALAPLRYVGDRSYAFYLWHWPVLILAEQYLEFTPPLVVNLMLLAGAFLLSIASYELVEDPIRRARWTGSRASLAFGASVAAVVVTAALSIRALDAGEDGFDALPPFSPTAIAALPVAHQIPSSRRESETDRALPAVVAAVLAARRGEPIPAGLTPPVGRLLDERPPYSLPPGCVPVARSSQTSSNICPVGRTRSSRSIAVVGDSHAQMWMPPIVRMAERDGWVVLPLLRPGCTPATWVDDYGLPLCKVWLRWMTEQMKRLRPDVTIVGGAVGGYRGAEARAAERGMLAMARSLKRHSGTIVLVGDPEGLQRSPVDCLLSRRASMARCTATWPPALLRPYDRIAAGARRLGVGFLETRGWFCFERQCPPVIGRTIAYKDPHHITGVYALRLSAVFRAAFRHELR